jgi:NADH-quinone oxidoreductase subunit J
VILGVIATVILKAQGMGSASLSDPITSTEDLSRVLFRELLLPFEVTSVLILIAILGAVALARPGNGDQSTRVPRIGERTSK